MGVSRSCSCGASDIVGFHRCLDVIMFTAKHGVRPSDSQLKQLTEVERAMVEEVLSAVSVPGSERIAEQERCASIVLRHAGAMPDAVLGAILREIRAGG